MSSQKRPTNRKRGTTNRKGITNAFAIVPDLGVQERSLSA